MTVSELARRMRSRLMGGIDLAWDKAAETLWTHKAETLWGSVEGHLARIEGEDVPAGPEALTDEQWDLAIDMVLSPAMQVLRDLRTEGTG